MADISKPHTFVDQTDAEADEVNADFDTLYTWVNEGAVHRDGTKAFTAVPSGPTTDPVSDNQFTRKGYVDVPTGRLSSTDASLPGTASTVTVNPGYNIDLVRGFDTDVSGNPQGLIVLRTGWYLVGGHMRWTSSGSGDYRIMEVRRNSTGVVITGDPESGIVGQSDPSTSILTQLTAGQKLNLAYRSNHAGFLSVNVYLWAIGIPGTFT